MSNFKKRIAPFLLVHSSHYKGHTVTKHKQIVAKRYMSFLDSFKNWICVFYADSHRSLVSFKKIN